MAQAGVQGQGGGGDGGDGVDAVVEEREREEGDGVGGGDVKGYGDIPIAQVLLSKSFVTF